MKQTVDPGWNAPCLVLWNITALLLLASWFVEPAHSLWLAADEGFFRFFNDSLKNGSDAWRMFWALTNHRLFDAISAGILIMVFVTSALRNGRETWIAHGALVTAIVIAAFAGTRIGHLLPVERASGTLLYSDVFRLNSWATWFETKDSSGNTFPGDHGMVALIGAGYAFRYLSRAYAFPAFIAGMIIVMPRLVSGAHWLSDELVGAGFVGFLVLSWSFCSPLGYILIEKSEQFLRRLFHG